MTQGRAPKRLRDAYGACQEIEAFTTNRSFLDYETDRGLRLVVERLFEILGEALNRASRDDSSLNELIPDLRKVVGVRNIIAHGYDIIRDEVIWDIAVNEVPVLQEQIGRVLVARGWE